MKIAVLLFGHLRDFEQCADSLNKNLLSRYDCDVFMHTWDELDSKTYSWHEQRVNPVNVSTWIGEKIEELYHPIDYIVEHQEKWQDEQIVKSAYTSNLSFSTAGMHFMFYSMNRANELRLAYQKKKNVIYDFIVVTRPDVELLHALDVEKIIHQANLLGYSIEKCRFFAPMQPSSTWPNAFVTNGTNDILFCAIPDVIDKYIKANKSIDIDFVEKHCINIVSVYTAKELKDGGVFPIPLSFPLGTDWTFSGVRTKRKQNKYIKSLLFRAGAKLLQPMAKLYDKCAKYSE